MILGKYKILISGDFNKESMNNALIKAFKQYDLDIYLFEDQNNYDRLFPVKRNNIFRKIFHRLFWKFFALKVGEAFLKKLNQEKYDIVFIIKGWFYHPEVIKKIKIVQPQAKVICFNPDNPFNTWHHGVSNDWIRGSIPHYDVYFIWGKFLIDKLYQAGAKKVEYLPFFYDPEVHYPVEVKDKNEKKYYGSDIAFIGTYDEEREWWLNHLKDYDLKIWGNDWWKANKDLQKKWMKKPAYGEEFRKICNSAKIVLNIIRKQNIPSHNMRTFEAPACRAFVLSTRTDEVKEFFEEDKEVVCFSTPEELKEKIDFYLKNDDLRKQIAENGYQKVKIHTPIERVKKILEVINSLK